jgi:putative transcriptional regulator
MAFKEFQEFGGGGGGGRGFLDGQILIALPTMTDPRFERSVVYMCAHSGDGAMGIIVNQLARNINFTELLRQLDIIGDGEEIRMPPDVGQMRVHVGGPVETGRGFVLHSADWFVDSSTLPIDDNICLTATLDILKAIAHGDGPESSMLALGYAGWAPGQLEAEIQANGWLHCGADTDLVFGDNLESKYELALKKLGIDPGHLAPDSGHA